ncbi:hypothetical protein FNV43_RR11307 [Rhamnella rubrinervis]|uniref:Uncharacterized protein n=1 Tax=Rhamnella rubrinervis TaxID=2594499 RepID=A0A8K0H648_9ROSA|nr:hypothetical protein FNV43_RR11307 [Rhamnella rubrinervis]
MFSRSLLDVGLGMATCLEGLTGLWEPNGLDRASLARWAGLASRVGWAGIPEPDGVAKQRQEQLGWASPGGWAGLSELAT